ncbi:MAG: sulfatase [Planctomycetota bacterium]
MSQPPNVLFINTHDSGRHFGCYGVPSVQSDAIDRIAADGVVMESMFSCGAHCSPSRASMMTGQYPQRHGVLALTHGTYLYELRDPRQHLSHLLRERGYATHLFHFQHEAENPRDLGFDGLHGLNEPAGRFETPAFESHRSAPLVADDVVRFLEGFGANSDGRPFFAQVGFFETHEPWDFGGVEPDRERGMWVPPWMANTPTAQARLAAFQGSIRTLDHAVGRIDEALHRVGLAEDTLVVFTTDHGISFPRAKCTMFDAGVEIAFVVRWPGGGLTGGQRCDALTSNVDFVPTLMDWLHLDTPGDLDGVSFASAVSDGDAARSEVYAQFTMPENQARMVRTDRHKLIATFTPNKAFGCPVDLERPGTFHGEPPLRLIDLEADPLEANNLADDPAYRDTRERLSASLIDWMQNVEDPIRDGAVTPPFHSIAMRDLLPSVG